MEEQRPLQVNLGEGVEPVHLRDWTAVERWLSKEGEAWNWLSPNGVDTNPGSTAEVVQERLQWLRKNVQNHRANEQSVEVLQGAFDEVFNPLRGPVLPSQSAEGQMIIGTRVSCGDDGAAAAYAFHLGRIKLANVGTRGQLTAVLLTAFPAMERASELSDRLGKERANLRTLQRNALAELEAFEARREGDWKTLLRRASGIGLRRLKKVRATWKVQQTSLNEKQMTAIADLAEVKNAYEEAMRLQAPVHYWQEKAGKHQVAERKAVTRLLWYFPLVAIFLTVLFGAAGWKLLTAGDQKPAFYLVVSSGLALISTLGFWVGRILTKLYLSEHHLRNDAEERAVMTTTYLALTRQSAAADVDRQIILNALFRTSPDGIVKYDGPGDLNVAALLSRLGVR